MPPRTSVMLPASRVAPRARTTSRSRSCVIGRAGRTPCCSNAMAAASPAPIQTGRARPPPPPEGARDLAQQVVRQRTGRTDALLLERDGRRLDGPDPDRQVPLPLRLLEQQ